MLIHTGDFQGSSMMLTVNAPIEKVQTGGFGDPNGLKPSANSKPNGRLIASTAGSVRYAGRSRTRQRIRWREGDSGNSGERGLWHGGSDSGTR